MSRIFILGVLFFSAHANASTAFASQFGHFSGGFFLTLLAAYVILRFMKKYQDKAFLWAAWFSTTFAFFDQTREFIFRGKFWGQAYDFACHALGAVVAYYLLRKMIKLTAKDDVATANYEDSQS